MKQRRDPAVDCTTLVRAARIERGHNEKARNQRGYVSHINAKLTDDEERAKGVRLGTAA